MHLPGQVLCDSVWSICGPEPRKADEFTVKSIEARSKVSVDE